MRIKISFSKGKTKKVKRLANHNQELQEILGYSERIIPIADVRKSSGPVALFEEIRQHACAVHNALKRHWKCPDQVCRPHRAYLNPQAGAKSAHLNLLFVLEGKQGSSLQPMKQEVVIQPAKCGSGVNPKSTPLSYVEQSSSFTVVQERFENIKNTKEASGFGKIFSKGSKASPTSKRGKQTRFEIPTLTITFDEQSPLHNSKSMVGSADIKHPSPQRPVNLCSSLRGCQDNSVGVISDEFDREFRLSKSSGHGAGITIPDTATLVPLPDLLDAHHRTSIEIARQRRFGMAVNIASALLQIQMSPWVSNKWSKYEFYFLADSQSVYSDRVYVSQTFVSGETAPLGPLPNKPSDFTPMFEDDGRACLFTVGVIILELIFGCNIESCKFRHLYYGPNNQPNDQTDVCTAKKWAKQVLGECGGEIDDVVQRCLNCSFDPKPCFKDKTFREAVYKNVIKPLADYSKIWPVVVP